MKDSDMYQQNRQASADRVQFVVLSAIGDLRPDAGNSMLGIIFGLLLLCYVFIL